MKADNPVETLAQAVYSALHNEKYLPDITYHVPTREDTAMGRQGEKKTRRPHVSEISVYHFPQMWGSTALGFGGIGGAAMTEAYTTVVILQDKIAAVFFAGRYAYTAEANMAFMNDLRANQMADTEQVKRYF